MILKRIGVVAKVSHFFISWLAVQIVHLVNIDYFKEVSS